MLAGVDMRAMPRDVSTDVDRAGLVTYDDKTLWGNIVNLYKEFAAAVGLEARERMLIISFLSHCLPAAKIAEALFLIFSPSVMLILYKSKHNVSFSATHIHAQTHRRTASLILCAIFCLQRTSVIHLVDVHHPCMLCRTHACYIHIIVYMWGNAIHTHL